MGQLVFTKQKLIFCRACEREIVFLISFGSQKAYKCRDKISTIHNQKAKNKSERKDNELKNIE